MCWIWTKPDKHQALTAHIFPQVLWVEHLSVCLVVVHKQ